MYVRTSNDASQVLDRVGRDAELLQERKVAALSRRTHT
jgi:hypothetical protein